MGKKWISLCLIHCQNLPCHSWLLSACLRFSRLVSPHPSMCFLVAFSGVTVLGGFFLQTTLLPQIWRRNTANPSFNMEPYFLSGWCFRIPSRCPEGSHAASICSNGSDTQAGRRTGTNEQLRKTIKPLISIFVKQVHGAAAFGTGQNRTERKGCRKADINENDESWAHYRGPQCAPITIDTIKVMVKWRSSKTS